MLAAVLVVVPPLIHLVAPGEGRSFEAVGLDETVHTEIRFRNERQDLDLAGLLFTPPGEGPFPAAVVIHGSGTSSRENGWYLTLVDYLHSHGVVVLLPDKRGSERSEGDWRTSSLEDLATDTEAAIDYLVGESDVPISAVGLIGMSQGGRIAPIVAAEDSRVSWVVNVVGPAVTAHEQLYYEEVHNLRQMGFLPVVSDLLALPSSWMLINVTDSQFWHAVGNSDPIDDWADVEQPTLVVYGESDTNVPTGESVERLEGLAMRSMQINVYPGSGHAVEDPEGQGNSIFRQDALDDIVTFVRDRSRGTLSWLGGAGRRRRGGRRGAGPPSSRPPPSHPPRGRVKENPADPYGSRPADAYLERQRLGARHAFHRLRSGP